MAEVLVMSRSNGITSEDWQLNDVVFVGEDGHPWGKSETDPTVFTVIKVPGTQAQVAATLKARHVDVNGKSLSQSLWRMNLGGVSPTALSSFVNKVSATKAFTGQITAVAVVANQAVVK